MFDRSHWIENCQQYLLCELLLLLLLLNRRLFNFVPQADGNPLGSFSCRPLELRPGASRASEDKDWLTKSTLGNHFGCTSLYITEKCKANLKVCLQWGVEKVERQDLPQPISGLVVRPISEKLPLTKVAARLPN
jgi:hypothetical protein